MLLKSVHAAVQLLQSRRINGISIQSEIQQLAGTLRLRYQIDQSMLYFKADVTARAACKPPRTRKQFPRRWQHRYIGKQLAIQLSSVTYNLLDDFRIQRYDELHGRILYSLTQLARLHVYGIVNDFNGYIRAYMKSVVKSCMQSFSLIVERFVNGRFKTTRKINRPTECLKSRDVSEELVLSRI